MDSFMGILTKILAAGLALLMAFLNLVGNILGVSSGGETTTVTTTVTSSSTTKQSGSTTSVTPVSGSFTFTSYGWGHGVGMSQDGAIVMAKEGKNYVEILKHYYYGTSVYYEKSGETPTTIKYGSKSVDLVEFLCKSVKQEIGNSAPKAAIMAQAAAIYSFLKYNKFSIASSLIAWDSDYKYEGTNLYDYVLAYLGMTSATATPVGKYVSADNGKTAANTVFCSNVAKHTVDAKTVWGGTGYSYLVPVSSPEQYESKSFNITADKMRTNIKAYDSALNISSNPAEWIKIIKQDAAISSNVGYVEKISVCGKEMLGNTFRSKVMGINTLRSHCFSVTYTP